MTCLRRFSDVTLAVPVLAVAVRAVKASNHRSEAESVVPLSPYMTQAPAAD